MSIISFTTPKIVNRVSWNCRIYQLHLCKGVKTPPNEYLGDNTKPPEVPVLELWGMWNNPSLPLFPGSL